LLLGLPTILSNSTMKTNFIVDNIRQYDIQLSADVLYDRTQFDSFGEIRNFATDGRERTIYLIGFLQTDTK
jgi:hypothetical protein